MVVKPRPKGRFHDHSTALGGTAGSGVAEPTRWVTDNPDTHSDWYVEHFRQLRAEGADLEGEARLVDAMLPRAARVLDAGCGQGRTGGALHARGHAVVGVDADPVLLAAARTDNPGPTWILADLADLDLTQHGIDEPFDAAVLAGNVISFVTPGTESTVLRRIADHLVPDGFLVTGFHTGMCDRETFDRAVEEAGLRIEHRFATWDLRPWPTDDDADFCVTILRRVP